MFEVWSIAAADGAATRVTVGGGLRAYESRDGRFLYYANDVPQVWRRQLGAQAPEELVTTFPAGTHWGGEWTVGERGLYYLSEQPRGNATIDFLPFGADRSRAVRVLSLTAPPARSGPVFALAPDQSWLVWAQDDYRNSDVMMVAQR